MDSQTRHSSGGIAAYATFSGISSFQILVMFRRGLFYTFLSLYLREFLGLSVTETTLMATFPMTVSSLCQMFLWGRVSDRLQLRRTLIIIGEVAAAIGTIVLWYAHRQPDSKYVAGYVIIIGLTVIEFFWSMSNVAWSALISDIYGESERARIQGQLVSIGAVGRITGVFLGSILYDGLGQHYKGWGFHDGSLFFVSAGAMLLSTVPMLFVPEGGHRRKDKDACMTDSGTVEYSIRIFALFLIAIALVNFGRNSMAVLRTPFVSLETGLALTPKQIHWVVNTHSVAMILMGPLVGLLCLRLTQNRALLMGTGVAVVALLVFGFAQNIFVACFGNVLAGVSEAIIVASSYAVASMLIPKKRRARLFGWFNATYFMSWGVGGTLMVAPLIDLLINKGVRELAAYRWGFVTATGITAAGFAMLVYVLLKIPDGTKRTFVGRNA